jgi:hypothetical protein
MPESKLVSRPLKKPSPPHPQSSFSAAFPAITYWVTACGWIEIGDDGMSPTWVRALDAGGVVWESEAQYARVDDALQAMDAALTTWLDENDVIWRTSE